MPPERAPRGSVSLAELDADPHPVLARLRASAPACWVPELDGWLVTGYEAAVAVLRDAETFTVDDPRFTTARVTGPSMLSLDGAEHARHRGPFARAFGRGEILDRLAEFTAAEAARLADAVAAGTGGSGAAGGGGATGGTAGGTAELRGGFAGPLAAAVMTEALGLRAVGVTPAELLGWYTDIVAAVAALPAAEPPGPAGLAGPGTPQTPGALGARGAAREPMPVASFAALAAAVREAAASGRAPLLAAAAAAGGLDSDELVPDAAVAAFGGIETTEGMICNAVLALGQSPGRSGGGGPGAIMPEETVSEETVPLKAVLLKAVPLKTVPALVEESLRMEPAAARVDRYATRDVTLGRAAIRRGDPVIVSLTGANRDPAVFGAPDRFDPGRPGADRHLAFARGPHFCLGARLARLETVTAVSALLTRFPGLRPDPGRPAPVRGLVFRKPRALHAIWDQAG